jgi:hypothetical protein
MGKAQGKKVDPSAVAAQAIEAQPSFGQIKPSRRHGSRQSDSIEEKTWRISSDPYKTPGSSGEGKETLACRWAATACRDWPAHCAHDGSVACAETLPRSKRYKDRAAVMRWDQRDRPDKPS